MCVGPQMAGRSRRSIYKNGDVLSAIQLLDVLSGKSHTLVGFKDLEIEDAVWTADGRGLLVVYYAKSTGTQIGFVSKRDGQFHAITKDTNTYQALTLSSDGKSLAAVQGKTTSTLHILPATGFTGNTPNPALPQIKNPLSFGWASSGELYVSDATSLVRTALDGNSKTTALQRSQCRDFGNRLFRWAIRICIVGRPWREQRKHLAC